MPTSIIEVIIDSMYTVYMYIVYYIVQELHTFYDHLKPHCGSFHFH